MTKRLNEIRQDRGDTKTLNLTISVYPGDIELMQWLEQFLGSSRSDAVRTAVRAMVVSLQSKGFETRA